MGLGPSFCFSTEGVFEMAEDKITVPVAAAPSRAFVFSGASGYPFNLRGSGFGTKKGTVLFSGRQVEITRWDDEVIKGFLPEDVKRGGEVLVTSADGKQQKGVF